MSSLPEFFSHVRLLATRPETVQRDEVIGVALSVFGARVVSVPDHQDQRAIYVETGDMDRVYEEISHKILQRETWLLHLKSYQALLSEFAEVARRANLLSPQDVTEAGVVYLAWTAAVEHFGEFILTPFVVEKLIDPVCQALVEHVYGKEKAASIMEIVSCPSELHAFQLLRLAILENIVNGNRSQEAARALADEYGWYNEYTFIEPLLDVEHFLHELQSLSPEEARLEQYKLRTEVQTHKEAFAHFLADCPNDELKHIAEVVHAYTFLRTDRVDKMKVTQVPLRRVFGIFAQAFSERTQTNWTREMVVACLSQELIDFIKSGVVPPTLEIQKRLSEPWVYYRDQTGAHMLEDKELVGEVQAIIKFSLSENQTIKGRTAFPGKVVGRVCLVRSKADLPRVQLGDILVAKTTMPDYTPAMKLAAGFVTEEGGITSHAAIISREWKKPCVVGTGNCTKILKEGDLVEVDAEQGIVTVIS